MEKVSTEGLVRSIRRWDLIAIAINAIIGAGIFGLPSDVYARIGSYSLIAFVACALVVTLIILCFAEVGSRFSETGGPYLYAREAFGPTLGFEVGWLIWLARLTAFAANCNLLVSYLGYFWTDATAGTGRAATIILVVVSLAAINILGVRQAAIVSNLFTVGKLVPLLIFIVAGLFFLSPHNYSFAVQPAYAPFSQSVLKLIYAFSGFEMAVIPAGEVRDPRRQVPLALVVAIAVVALLYILIQVVCIGTLPELAASQRPLADAATRFLGHAGGALISAGALISIVGNLNIIVLSGSRIPFAMAEQNQLPSFVGRVHQRFFTPYVAILISAAVMLVLALSGTFIYALTISTIARLLTYAATCAALPVFRRRKNAPPAKFNIPGGTVAALASLALAAWLLSNSTLAEARDACIAALVGLLVYFVYRLLQRQSNRRAQSS
jgi:APA family basic amino acid/polyamine antiporter